MSVKEGLLLENVVLGFGGRRVVDDVSLTVEPGELVCLLGPSGCGKTSTLRLAAGLEKPDKGLIFLNGRLVSGDGTHLPPESRHVGFLFQDYALFPHLNVLGNVAFGLDDLPARDRSRQALDKLEQVGMLSYADAWPHQLSGGQQQRVALARALAPNPSLMLLDEPFSGLDKRLRDLVRDETLHVLKSSRVSTLMVTHDPEEAMFMADRIAVMKEGRIVQCDTPVNLYSRPADPFVASFFGEVNSVEAKVRAGRIETCLGSFDARNFIDGAKVELLIRPEAVNVLPDPDGKAVVLASRLLGRTSLIHLKVENPGGTPVHLHARLASRLLPPENSRASLELDSSQIFLFPISSDA
ncbi:MAG: ABC transporter ATP-binding protein [Rhodospirillales bacterium]|nr:ABC transporter ATP-binding protein [Rhodospirillales bacterium]